MSDSNQNDPMVDVPAPDPAAKLAGLLCPQFGKSGAMSPGPFRFALVAAADCLYRPEYVAGQFYRFLPGGQAV